MCIPYFVWVNMGVCVCEGKRDCLDSCGRVTEGMIKRERLFIYDFFFSV